MFELSPESKKKLRATVFFILVIPVLIFLSGLSFYLPSTVKVKLTGTEIKRMDSDTKTDNAQTGPRDVRLVLSKNIETDDALVFRNEDTRWGWPPYFKFNSGDLAGDIANIMDGDKDAVVLISYYGKRIKMLDMYPNIISLKKVDKDYTHIPWFNIIFFVVFFGLIAFVAFKIRGFLKRRTAAKAEKAKPQEEPKADGANA